MNTVVAATFTTASWGWMLWKHREDIRCATSAASSAAWMAGRVYGWWNGQSQPGMGTDDGMLMLEIEEIDAECLRSPRPRRSDEEEEDDAAARTNASDREEEEGAGAGDDDAKSASSFVTAWTSADQSCSLTGSSCAAFFSHQRHGAPSVRVRPPTPGAGLLGPMPEEKGPGGKSRENDSGDEEDDDEDDMRFLLIRKI